MSFEVFCRRIDETFEYYRNESIVKTNSHGFYTTTELDTLTLQDHGGCVKAGPGFLDLPDPGDFTFNSRNMRVNESYVMVIVATKDTRRALVYLQIDLVEGSPPSIVIE